MQTLDVSRTTAIHLHVGIRELENKVCMFIGKIPARNNFRCRTVYSNKFIFLFNVKQMDFQLMLNLHCDEKVKKKNVFLNNVFNI